MPVPGPTVVLVAVKVSAVNPADTFIRSRRYPTPVTLLFVGSLAMKGVMDERRRSECKMLAISFGSSPKMSQRAD